MDEYGAGTLVLSPSIAQDCGFVGIGALKRVFLLYFTTSMNSHVIYFVNLPD
jgi:hypothetical protein